MLQFNLSNIVKSILHTKVKIESRDESYNHPILSVRPSTLMIYSALSVLTYICSYRWLARFATVSSIDLWDESAVIGKALGVSAYRLYQPYTNWYKFLNLITGISEVIPLNDLSLRITMALIPALLLFYLLILSFDFFTIIATLTFSTIILPSVMPSFRVAPFTFIIVLLAFIASSLFKNRLTQNIILLVFLCFVIGIRPEYILSATLLWALITRQILPQHWTKGQKTSILILSTVIGLFLLNFFIEKGQYHNAINLLSQKSEQVHQDLQIKKVELTALNSSLNNASRFFGHIGDNIRYFFDRYNVPRSLLSASESFNFWNFTLIMILFYFVFLAIQYKVLTTVESREKRDLFKLHLLLLFIPSISISIVFHPQDRYLFPLLYFLPIFFLLWPKRPDLPLISKSVGLLIFAATLLHPPNKLPKWPYYTNPTRELNAILNSTEFYQGKTKIISDTQIWAFLPKKFSKFIFLGGESKDFFNLADKEFNESDIFYASRHDDPLIDNKTNTMLIDERLKKFGFKRIIIYDISSSMLYLKESSVKKWAKWNPPKVLNYSYGMNYGL